MVETVKYSRCGLEPLLPWIVGGVVSVVLLVLWLLPRLWGGDDYPG